MNSKRETANARPDERAVAERLVEELLAQWGCPDGDIAEAHNALLAHFDQVRNSADAEIAKVMAERDELQRKLKNYEPVSTYNGRDIDSWRKEADALRASNARDSANQHNEVQGFCLIVDKQSQRIKKLEGALQQIVDSYAGFTSTKEMMYKARKALAATESHKDTPQELREQTGE